MHLGRIFTKYRYPLPQSPYDTGVWGWEGNVGDAIQCLAIEHLYHSAGIAPESLVLVNREELREYDGPRCILPVNGWFADFFGKNLPLPPSSKIHPFFLGFHLSKQFTSHQAFIQKNLQRWMSQEDAIGCRDYTTRDFLASLGIPAYYSGCATIAFPQRAKAPDKGKLFVVDLHPDTARKLPQHILDEADFSISHFFYFSRYPVDDEGALGMEAAARAILGRYRDEARLVVTSRLHVALPCLAMGVPVVFIDERGGDSRFEALQEYLPIYTPEMFHLVDWAPTPPDVSAAKQRMKNLFHAGLSRAADKAGFTFSSGQLAIQTKADDEKISGCGAENIRLQKAIDEVVIRNSLPTAKDFGFQMAYAGLGQSLVENAKKRQAAEGRLGSWERKLLRLGEKLTNNILRKYDVHSPTDIIRAFDKGGTQTVEKWEELPAFHPAWETRIKDMAALLRSGETVVDLGCGPMWLKKYLPAGCVYHGVDCARRDESTTVCDFNKGEFAHIPADTYFISGCLEYIADADLFLSRVASCAKRILLSYSILENYPDAAVRKNLGWVNHFSRAGLEALFRKNGLSVISVHSTCETVAFYNLRVDKADILSLLASSIPLSQQTQQLIASIDKDGLSVLGTDALTGLAEAVGLCELQDISGIFVETGCSLGGAAIVLAASKRKDREVHIFGALEMSPSTGGIAGLQENIKASFKKYLAPLEDVNVRFMPGLYEDTLVIDSPIALAHINCGQYEPARSSLARIAPCLAIGGIIVIDDYDHCSGCRKAVDEFLDATQAFDVVRKSNLMLVRRASDGLGAL